MPPVPQAYVPPKLEPNFKAFKKWNAELSPAKRTSRVVDKVTKITIGNDVLDLTGLTNDEKCSGYHYCVYRFPASMNLSEQEQAALRFLLKKDLNRTERKQVIKTLREVHHREGREKEKLDVANTMLTLSAPARQGEIG